MRKILILLFISFLILTSCSDRKLKTALENCATESFQWESPRYVSSNYENDPRVVQIKKKIKETLSHIKTVENVKKEIFSEWREKNPMPTISTLDVWKELGYSGLTDPKFYELSYSVQTALKKRVEEKRQEQRTALKTWSRNSESIIRVQTNEISEKRDEIKKLERKIEQIRKNLSRNNFLKMSFKDKKQVGNFMDYYKSCENEYNNTPNTFFEKWKK